MLLISYHMDLSNVNFGVCKTRKTRLDRVRQQNSNNQRNLSFVSVSRRPVRNGGQLTGSAERTQALCSPRLTVRRLPRRLLLTCGFLSRAGGNSSPCSQVESACQMLSGRPRSLIPGLFTVVVSSPSAHRLAPSRAGSQGGAGPWATRRGPGLRFHGAQAFRMAGKIPESTTVTNGVLLASGFISPSVPVLTLLVLTGS